jgi:hypothetical protein
VSDFHRIVLVDLFMVREVASALAGRGGQVAFVAGGVPYQNPWIRRVLETGLVVTYGRAFASPNRGYGVLAGELIPAEHAALHAFLIDRRNKADAHTDSGAAAAHHRFVAGDDRETQAGEPSPLTQAQLEELDELCGKLEQAIKELLNAT